MKSQRRYRLINSYSGKELGQADNLEELQHLIDEEAVNTYTVQDTVKGWFGPATLLFKNKKPEPVKTPV